MPLSLDELVANAKYADDLKIKIGDEEVSVADLRSFHKKERDAFAAAEKRRKEADDEYNKAQKLGADALALYESVKGENRGGDKGGDRGNDDIDWSDPALKPLKAKLDAFDAATKKWEEKSKQLEAAIASGFSFVTDYVWQSGYNSLDELSRPKDKKLEDLVKYAQEQRITDRWGLPDPIKAARMLTEGDRQAIIEKKAREEGRKEGERAARAAAINHRPGAIDGTRQVVPAKKAGEAPVKTVKELLSKAMQDPEIQRIAGGIQE